MKRKLSSQDHVSALDINNFVLNFQIFGFFQKSDGIDEPKKNKSLKHYDKTYSCKI